MIYTDYSQHIPKITASPVCTAIKNDTSSIKLCFSFSQDLKIQVVYYWKCSSFWGTESPRPPAGASPLDPTGGLPSPDPWFAPLPPLHLLDPPLCAFPTVVIIICKAHVVSIRAESLRLVVHSRRGLVLMFYWCLQRYSSISSARRCYYIGLDNIYRVLLIVAWPIKCTDRFTMLCLPRVLRLSRSRRTAALFLRCPGSLNLHFHYMYFNMPWIVPCTYLVV